MADPDEAQPASTYKYMPYLRKQHACEQDEYELNLATLLALKIVLYGDKDSWLAFNADGVGEFDDVIATCNNVSYLFQLKHSSRGCVTKAELLGTSGDFSICKYMTSISHLLHSTDIKDKKAISKYLLTKKVFILYTNRDIKDHGILEAVDGSSLFNTSKAGNHSVYKIKNEDGEYCESMRLYANQATKYDMKQLIKDEIEKAVERFGLKGVTTEVVVLQFSSYVKNWAQRRLGGVYCLTRAHILASLADILLMPHQLLDTEPQQCSRCEPLVEWHQLIKDKFITFINADDDHITFTKQYLSNELQMYFDETSEEWYNPYVSNVRKIVSHILGGRGTSYNSLYKCMWYERRLPLMLQMDDSEQLNIFRFLDLHGCKLKFIVFTKFTLPSKLVQVQNCFLNLQDIGSLKRRVLSKPVRFQGRTFRKLDELVDDSMLSLIKTEDIIDILADKFNIGNTFNSLPAYYIEPQLSRSLFDINILLEEKQCVYLVENPKNTQLIVPTCDLDDFHTNAKCSTIALNGYVHLHRVKEKLKHINEPVLHFRVIDENTLEWIQTYKDDNTDVSGYKIPKKTKWTSVKDILNNYYYFEPQPVVVINDIPGMGKSTLLNNMAFKSSKYVWVIKIHLYKYIAYLKEAGQLHPTDHRAHLKSFCEVVLKHNRNSELSLRVFKKFVESRNLFIMLDGFDEISVQDIDYAIKMMQTFQTTGYSVVVATRPVMLPYLHEKLNITLTTLKPLDTSDQTKFLTNFFGDKGENEILPKFIQRLLTIPRSMLYDVADDFLQVPIQIEMLAEVFHTDYDISVKENVVRIDSIKDMLDLYNKFFTKRFNIYCEKMFGSTRAKARSAMEKFQTMYSKYQQLIAVQLVFDKERLRNLQIDQLLESCFKENEALALQGDGNIIAYRRFKEEQFSFVFVHRTFAEFMAAKWLFDNYNDEVHYSVVRALLETRYCGWYDFLFKIFDLLVVQESSRLPKLIINGVLPDLKRLICSSPQLITEKDIIGRSALHLIAIYDNVCMRVQILDKSENIESMSDVIESIPTKILEEIHCDDLGYTPIYYAVANHSYGIANKLFEKLPACDINFCIPLEHKNYLFYHCCQYGYKALFRKALPYFALRDLLARNVEKDEELTVYCARSKESNIYAKFENFLNDIDETYLYEFVPVTKDFYEDLRLAVVFGGESNVNSLIQKGVDVNESDVDENTPLHYAVKHERLNVIKKLLSNGADIDRAGCDGFSALHIVAKNGNNNILQYLLKRKCNINQQDSKGNTPLMTALQSNQLQAAALLISKGADCSIPNNEQTFPLHQAAKIAADDIILHILRKKVDINVQNAHHYMPLHYAVLEHRTSTVELLLSKGSQVNAYMNDLEHQNSTNCLIYCSALNKLDLVKIFLAHKANPNLADSEKCTALHRAVLSDNRDIVWELLEAKSDVNVQDVHGDTPLHLSIASNYENMTITNMLLSKQPNFNLYNDRKKTPFHYAVARNSFGLVQRMIMKGADINAVDDNNSTPLLAALMCRQIKVAELLLQHRPNVNILNNAGLAPIHSALQLGNPQLLRRIVKMGANVNIKDHMGNSPLHYMLLFIRDVISTTLLVNYELEPCLRILLAHGADVTIQNDDGQTPLDIACDCQKMEAPYGVDSYMIFKYIIKVLMDDRADPGIGDNYGRTSLDLLPPTRRATV